MAASPAPEGLPRLTFHPGEDMVGVGFALRPELVLEGYRRGVFPWFTEGMPVLWWCPDPRACLPLDGSLRVSRRLRRTLRRADLEVRHNTAFDAVMEACRREGGEGAWIHGAMQDVYGDLHRGGHAHSVEIWREGKLVGGVYGVAFGHCFAAESMFHSERDMSKVALVSLVEHLRTRGYELLDVQFQTPHLETFGCFELPRKAYLDKLRALRDEPLDFEAGEDDATRP